MIPTEHFKLQPPEKGGFSILMVGSTRSGKSTMLSHILKNYFKDHNGVLMTNSPQADVYKEMDIPQSPEFIPRIIKDLAVINKETKNKYDFLICLDDIVTKAKFHPEILKLLAIYRNSNCSAIINVQALTLMNAAGRTNCNVVLLFKQNTDAEIERCVKTFLSSYFPQGMRMADKVRWFRENTEDHNFIVVDTLNNHVFRSKLAPDQIVH